ncbi:hypothetical protein F5Y08DRAFT_307927 [Xylaria arbuscula]|nr:hypothetical protein F5Y08DRAFT_307927 [Xylaria arbuscula]
MFLFLLSPFFLWVFVFTFFILTSVRNIILILQTIRWTLVIWLLGCGILAGEALRAGLLVINEPELQLDIHFYWSIWILLIVGCGVDWIFLFPAIGLPLIFLSYPQARMLFNFGLVKLGWLEPVHSPITFLLREFVLSHEAVRRVDVVEWMPQMLKEKLAYKLRPARAWHWFENFRHNYNRG